MGDTTAADGKPKRKSMFLGPQALADLAETAARRRTEREAVEEALALLVEQDRRNDAMDDYFEWARQEYGEPTEEEKAIADELIRQARELRDQ